MENKIILGDLVLYKNNQMIAFNKPVGIPVQADKTGDKAMLDLAEIYTKSTLHLLHRLDRPVSGVVLFAKARTALVAINEQFKKREVQKIYWAVVQNKPTAESGTLSHYLIKNGRKNLSFASEEEKPDSKHGVLNYRLMASIDRYHLLEIELESGRHHQIRAQLSAIGSPVKGDVKYGFRRGNKDRSIHLHARKLIFAHPVSGEKQEIVADTPDDVVWNALLAKI